MSDEVRHLWSLNVSVSDIARRLHISRASVYRTLRRINMSTGRFSDISDAELHNIICDVKRHHPHCGEIMLMGHLRSRGIIVARQRVRSLLYHLDINGIADRRSSTIKRRQYYSPCPNFVWHIDGLHKLIRWKFVIHGAIDGFSRLVTFLQCSDNNRSETVYEVFLSAVAAYELPLHVRTDHGGENILVWQHMSAARPDGSSVIVGSSVHNERVERMWRDVNRLVSQQFRSEFYQLENDDLLNPDNETDIFCLHLVYLSVINDLLDEHRLAHNNHSVRTAGNYTPHQLHYANQHLLQLHSASPADEHSRDLHQLQATSSLLPHVNVDNRDISSILPSSLMSELRHIVNVHSPLTLRNGRQCYVALSQKLGEYLQTFRDLNNSIFSS